MTAALEHLVPVDAEHGVPDRLGACLEDLQQAWGASCVIESRCGRAISHALLPDAPSPAVQAVLRRSARPLHDAQGPSRSSRIGPAATAVTTSFADWNGSVTVVPLRRLGWLWVMHRGTLPPAEVQAAVDDVAALLGRVGGTATDTDLFDELHGRVWPPRSTAGPGSAVVVCRSLTGTVPALELHRTLRDALSSTPRVRVTAAGGVAWIVLRADGAQRLAEEALRRAERELGCALAAVVAPVGDDLCSARLDAEAALDARAVEGRCLTVSDCRPYVVLPRLLSAVDDGPGPDPVAALDDAAQTTLLAWLDLFGDTTAVAAYLGVHVNTVRYRLKQLEANPALDLADPVARIDLHLRLLRSRSRAGGRLD